MTKKVIVRTIKMRKETVDELQFSSKFDRGDLMRRLREEGYEVARSGSPSGRTTSAAIPTTPGIDEAAE